ncbi:MAG: hypothetical protein ABR587_15910 [Candidatus Binatia bacterium]
MQQLRFGLALPFTLLLAVAVCTGGCGSDSGSGNGNESVTIRYGGDRSAYGISVRSGAAIAGATGDAATASASSGALVAAASRSARQAGEVACTMSVATAAAGCTASIATSASGVDLALYGCFFDAGDELFDCELPTALIDGLRSDATVLAGCGCRSLCPASPSIDVCNDGDSACVEAARLRVAIASRPPPDIVVTTQPATGETTCSTCCETDFHDDIIASVVSSEPISEFEVTITFADECRFDVNGTAECDLDDPDAHWGEQRLTGSTLVHRFCLSADDPTGNTLSVPFARCRGLIDDVTVTRALGRNFAPLSTPPQVRFR